MCSQGFQSEREREREKEKKKQKERKRERGGASIVPQYAESESVIFVFQ